MKSAPALKSKSWETFCRIPVTMDRPPDLSEAWAVGRGIGIGAVAVLEIVRRRVLPLVRLLERRHGLIWHSFLVHDCSSGVPVTDRACIDAFVHLRLVFKRAVDLRSLIRPSVFELTRPDPLSRQIAGLNLRLLRSGSAVDAWQLIGEQSDLLLRIIEMHKANADPVALLVQLRQFLHYFANATQMKVE